MNYIKASNAETDNMPEPNKRIIKHLAAPWNIGTKKVWVGSTELEPQHSSNLHTHDTQEEVFYVEIGKGQIKVGEEIQDVEKGDVVYVPEGEPHQLINNSNSLFKTINVVAPPFIPEKYKLDHNIN